MICIYICVIYMIYITNSSLFISSELTLVTSLFAICFTSKLKESNEQDK